MARAENNAGRPLSKEELIAGAPPANVTDYYNYAAKELASTYYGGVPGMWEQNLSHKHTYTHTLTLTLTLSIYLHLSLKVVYLTPTKENALAGTLFGCDFDGEALIEEYKKLMFMEFGVLL